MTTTDEVTSRPWSAAPRTRPAGRSGGHGRWVALPALAVLLVAELALLPGLRWQVNPDGVVYASLAEHVVAGRLADAVTGYWSPLLPGLAAPLVAVGVDALTALRVVLLAGAAAAVLGAERLLADVGAGPALRAVLTTAAVPVTLLGALFGLYPDVLLGAALLWGLRLAVRADGARAGLGAGAVLGLAYLAKAVGLPAALALLVVVAVVRLGLRVGAPRELVRVVAAAAAGLALVAGPWVVAVSLSVGQPTIGTAGAFNAALVEPGVAGHPLLFAGLYPPADPDVTTPWERPEGLPVPRADDPPGLSAPPAPGTSPGPGATGASGASGALGVTVVDRVTNALDQGRVAAGSLVRRGWPLALPALAGLALAVRTLVRSRRSPRPADDGKAAPDGVPLRPAALVLAAVGVAAALVVGTSGVVVVERYLWFPLLALLVPTGLALALLGRRAPRAAVALALAAALGQAVAFGPTLADRWDEDRDVWRLAADRCGPDLADRGAPGLPGPVAGVSDWERSQLLAHLCGVDYLGLTGPVTPLPTAERAAADAGAAVLVVWPGEPAAGQRDAPQPRLLPLTGR